MTSSRTWVDIGPSALYLKEMQGACHNGLKRRPASVAGFRLFSYRLCYDCGSPATSGVVPSPHPCLGHGFFLWSGFGPGPRPLIGLVEKSPDAPHHPLLDYLILDPVRDELGNDVVESPQGYRLQFLVLKPDPG